MGLKAFDQTIKKEVRPIGVALKLHYYEQSIQNENFLALAPTFLRTFLCPLFFIWPIF
jgi:hypothetical protein